MRAQLITFAAIAALASFATSAATTGGSSGGTSSGSGASAGAASSGGSGGGGSHGGGGAHAGGGAHGGSHFSGGGGYAGRGGDAGHSIYGARGGYGVVGYESTGMGHSGTTPRGEYGSRGPLVLGPRTGSAATARLLADRIGSRAEHPDHRPGHPHHRPRHYRGELREFNTACQQIATSPCANEVPTPFCIPEDLPIEDSTSADRSQIVYGAPGCIMAIKLKVPAGPLKGNAGR
jgi:hypothetical protein